MKHKLIALTVLLTTLACAGLVCTPCASAAGDGHDTTKKIAGPNGGRVITTTKPHCEVLITQERKLKVTFLDKDNKPAALKSQSLTGSGGDRTNPTKFTFVKSGDSLVSEQALPAGDSLPVILQIKTTADAKPVTHRFAANLPICGGCKLAEYACTCDDHAH